MSFTHLHLASGYSFKYGTTLPEELVEHAAELGMNSIALTDRGTLAGAIRFAKSCQSNSIAPIIGIDIEYENKSRITLLATPGNWSSLVRLVTEIKNLTTPISFEFFKKYSKYTSNLLALHGPSSNTSKSLFAKRNNEALSLFNQTRDIFKNQAIECVSHLTASGTKSTSHAARMLAFAIDNDLPALLRVLISDTFAKKPKPALVESKTKSSG